MLIPLGQCGRDTDDEQKAQIVDQDHHGFVHQLADDRERTPCQEGQQSSDSGIGQQRAYSQDHTGYRQIHQRLNHCFCEHFQSVHELFHTILLLKLIWASHCLHLQNSSRAS